LEWPAARDQHLSTAMTGPRHRHGISWSYRRAVLRTRVGRVGLKLQALPGRLKRDAPRPPATAGVQAAANAPAFERTITEAPTVHDQLETDHCCANAVATAMETRIIGGEGLPPVVIDAEHIYSSRPSRDLGAATRAAMEGARDSAGGIRRATRKRVNAASADQMCALMQQFLDDDVPLSSRILVTPNFDLFQGAGIYRASGTSFADHAVCIIGHGVTADGTRYWVAKNSYGADWGDAGRVRLPWKDPAIAPEMDVYAISQVTP